MKPLGKHRRKISLSTWRREKSQKDGEGYSHSPLSPSRLRLQSVNDWKEKFSTTPRFRSPRRHPLPKSAPQDNGEDRHAIAELDQLLASGSVSEATYQRLLGALKTKPEVPRKTRAPSALELILDGHSKQPPEETLSQQPRTKRHYSTRTSNSSFASAVEKNDLGDVIAPVPTINPRRKSLFRDIVDDSKKRTEAKLKRYGPPEMPELREEMKHEVSTQAPSETKDNPKKSALPGAVLREISQVNAENDPFAVVETRQASFEAKLEQMESELDVLEQTMKGVIELLSSRITGKLEPKIEDIKTICNRISHGYTLANQEQAQLRDSVPKHIDLYADPMLEKVQQDLEQLQTAIQTEFGGFPEFVSNQQTWFDNVKAAIGWNPQETNAPLDRPLVNGTRMGAQTPRLRKQDSSGSVYGSSLHAESSIVRTSSDLAIKSETRKDPPGVCKYLLWGIVAALIASVVSFVAVAYLALLQVE